MSLLEETIAFITPASLEVAEAAQRALDDKTKPRRSLGRLEEIACRVAAMRGTIELEPGAKCIVVMGADHGVAAEGVSAYPSTVTRQMLLNFAAGGAAINVLAREVGARVVVVDMGVREPLPDLPGLRAARIGPGTANFAQGAAMRRADAVAAIEAGIAIAREAVADGAAGRATASGSASGAAGDSARPVERVDLLGLGEMGIGNTTAASALTAALTGADPAEVTGRGTGIDDAALAHKVDVVRRALSVNRPDASDPLDVLAKLGGFEIAGLAGVAIGGAAERVPVVVDGFIASAAALVAVRLCPHVRDFLIAAHRSVEIGHGRLLEELGTRALLDLDLRLGEGTGAALAMPIIDASLRVLREMATFSAAGVSDSGA